MTTFAVQNWGRWDSEEQCCAPGAAHSEGCIVPRVCYVPTSWEPKRACGKVEDMETCTRGWGAFLSEEACCEKGAAFNEGCSDDPRIKNLEDEGALLGEDSNGVDNAETVVSFDGL